MIDQKAEGLIHQQLEKKTGWDRDEADWYLEELDQTSAMGMNPGHRHHFAEVDYVEEHGTP